MGARTKDHEFHAMATIAKALDPLPQDAKDRVIDYVVRRYRTQLMGDLVRFPAEPAEMAQHTPNGGERG